MYLEKPMVHDLPEGPTLIEMEKKTNRVLQVGSQFANSIHIHKARDLYESGAIGKINMVEARYNRNSSIGAWQYTIPPNVSEEEIAWDRFLGDAPDRDFDPVRFFRWRNCWEYGTGVAGDLFMHLLTAIHSVTGSIGPATITSTGGLRFWTDSRDVPDVYTSLFAYPDTDAHPEFTASLQTNFADGSGSGQLLRFIGSEGAMEVSLGGKITLTQAVRTSPSLERLMNGYNSVRTFSEEVQEAFRKQYKQEHDPSEQAESLNNERTFQPPQGYDPRIDHFADFFSAIRSDQAPVEDATFSHRAAAPALLCNKSYREGQRYKWDPGNLEASSA